MDVQLFLETAIRLVQILDRLHTNNRQANILVDRQSFASFVNEAGTILTGEFKDPLPYLSPEQSNRVDRRVDFRSDFYSLGVMFYRLLVGRLPFYSEDPMEVAHFHIAQKAKPLTDVNPDLPQVLSNIVGKLMEKNPGDRYQTTSGLLADLERCRISWQPFACIRTTILPSVRCGTRI